MQRLRNTRRENAITRKRLYVVIFINLVFYCILLSRMYNLQINQYQHFQRLATQNQTRTIKTYPPRGAIIDRNGKALAKTVSSFYGCYDPSYIDSVHLEFLKTREIKHSEHDQTHCSQLESWDFAHISTWPDVTLKTIDLRKYPYADTLAHIIGYAGQRSFNPQLEAETNRMHTGATGIEKEYDHLLNGTVGERQHHVDARGRLIKNTPLKHYIPSEPLETSIDIHLQQKAYNELFGHRGTVIALNPNTGEILAAVSSPSFDPHNPTQISQTNAESTQMFNRITQAKYPPASLLKPFLALMALQDGFINPDEEIDDPGYLDVGDKRFHDWIRSGHGQVNLDKALRISCDVYFYRLAQKIGINRMVDYLMMFGLDKKTGIDIPHEKTSLVPKIHYRKKRPGGWFEGHTIMTAIGQGDVSITPIALARATMLLANKGYDHKLHIAKNDDAIAKEPSVQAEDKHWRRIHKALENATSFGTAKAFRQSSYSVAGKTGSAQVKSIKNKAEYRTLPQHQKDHHLFIGFSPVEKPQIAIVVIIEHEHQAVLIAKHMLDFYWQNNLSTDETATL